VAISSKREGKKLMGEKKGKNLSLEVSLGEESQSRKKGEKLKVTSNSIFNVERGIMQLPGRKGVSGERGPTGQALRCCESRWKEVHLLEDSR